MTHTTTLREAAQQALEALEAKRATACGWRTDCDKAITALRAALAEEALQNLTDVQQEMERNFCPRCGKRTNDIHTCTPPHEEHFCDTHCTWLDHAPGCVRAEPVQEPVAWRTKNATPPGGYVVFQQYPSAVANLGGEIEPLYTASPQRKPLAEWQINDLIDQIPSEDIDSWSFRQGVYVAEEHHGVRP